MLSRELHNGAARLQMICRMLRNDERCSQLDEGAKLGAIVRYHDDSGLSISFDHRMAPGHRNVCNPQVVVVSPPNFDRPLLIEVEHMQALRLAVIAVWHIIVV